MKIQNSKFKIQNSKFKIQNSKFKLLTLLLCSTLFVLMSCEKDLYENSIQNDSRDIIVKSISIDDVQSNQEALKKLTDPKSRFRTNANSSNKALNDTINNFTIDIDNGLYIEVGNYNSYTFKINRPNGSNYLLENIIVSKKNETEYETFINQYNITEQELELIENRAFVDLTGKINKIALESATLNDHLASKYYFNGSCYEDDFVYVAGNVCEAGFHDFSYIMANMGSESQCEFFLNGTYTATTGAWIIKAVLVPCDNTGGGDGPGGDTSGGHPGSGGSGSTYTGAVGSNPNNTKIKTFIRNLLPNVKQCYDSLVPQKKEKILSFLSSSLEALSDCPSIANSDDELFNFAQELISSQCGPNAEEDWNDFESWFSNDLEGVEDNSYLNLDDLSLVFPTQNLPTFDDFLLAYPSHLDADLDESIEVYTAVGGAVLTKYLAGARNTCALRVSKGLNYSGVTIPNIPGVTVKGADNKNYFLVAKNLLSWMKKTFDTPTGDNHLTECQGGTNGINFPTLLQNKQGIYIMIPKSPSLFEASGHADMFFNGDCDGSCYFGATGGVQDIFFWELP